MENNTPAPSGRRRRQALACEPCRRKKIKCNRNDPCEHCTRSKKEGSCIYLDDNRRGPNRARQPPLAASDKDPAGHQKSSSTAAGAAEVSRLSTSHNVPLPYFNLPSPTSNVSRDPPNGNDLAGTLDATRPAQQAHPERQFLSTPKDPESVLDNASQAYEVAPTVRGNFSKTRYFGQSHWTNYAYQFYEVVQRFESDETSETRAVYDNCKSLAKAIKAQEVVRQPLRADIHEHVPSREIADQLVQAYIRTSESVFRILHVPSFLRGYDDYWADPSSSSYEFVVKLLLVMAIGMVFSSERNMLRYHYSAPSQWIYTAQSWLISPFEKNRINVSGIQIYCLLLLARQTNGVGGDLVWISAGSLLRSAMHMGLHIDPSRVTRMSSFDQEIRRRLWATVLEIILQSSMDAGGLPLVSMQDIDCELPANIEDDQMATESVPKPAEHYTGTSIQIALMKSFSVRLEIARYVNDFKSESSYDKTLQLASCLSSFCRANFELFRKNQSQASLASPFQVKLLDLLTYRFLLALHHPFAIKAKTNPTYYFSRKTSMEISMSLLSHSTLASEHQSTEDDFARLGVIGTAVFRDVPLQATSMICDELINQLEEDKTSFIPMSVSFRYQNLHQIVEKFIRILGLRIKNGETNVRGHLFFSCLLAQIDAMQAGTSTEQGMSKAVKGSLDHCYRILRNRADESGLDTSPETDPTAIAGGIREGIAGAEGVCDWFEMDEMVDQDSFLQGFI